jgi:hypothetical protein
VKATTSSVFGLGGVMSKAAVGGRLATSIANVATSVAPFESVTWRRTVCAPGVAKLVVGAAAVLSPKVPLPSRSQL